MKNLCFLITVIILSSNSCSKKTNTGIPYYNVNTRIYTTDPIFINLTVVGGWEYINGGSKGIIVYRANNDEFKAYDRHCTYQPNDDCSRVHVDSSNVAATDTCCGSSFLLTNGSVLNSPAVSQLKEYQTSFDGSVLRIYN